MFQEGLIDTGEVRLFAKWGGRGPALLLLHGYPETHHMWRKVAPRLAERFTLVMPDLRGYGESDKPPGGGDHGAYAKRTMAADCARLMTHLGHERFALAGHDRGARVAYRLAQDHGARVRRLALLDIVPTAHVYRTVDRRIASAYFHWFLLPRPAPFPERLIAGAEKEWLDWIIGSAKAGAIEPEARAAYDAAFLRPETIHATCEDYRAGASIDLVHDKADAGRPLACPLLVLHGQDGALDKLWDIEAAWRGASGDLRLAGLPGGHFFAEEYPQETAEALLEFLTEATEEEDP